MQGPLIQGMDAERERALRGPNTTLRKYRYMWARIRDVTKAQTHP